MIKAELDDDGNYSFKCNASAADIVVFYLKTASAIEDTMDGMKAKLGIRKLSIWKFAEDMFSKGVDMELAKIKTKEKKDEKP